VTGPSLDLAGVALDCADRPPRWTPPGGGARGSRSARTTGREPPSGRARQPDRRSNRCSNCSS